MSLGDLVGKSIDYVSSSVKKGIGCASLGAVLAFGGINCGTEAGETGSPCSTATDCKGDRDCIDGVCGESSGGEQYTCEGACAYAFSCIDEWAEPQEGEDSSKEKCTEECETYEFPATWIGCISLHCAPDKCKQYLPETEGDSHL